MRRLAGRLGVAVEPIEAIGFDGDAIEAQCFAYLALRSRQGAPLSFPTTTGVPTPMTGGVFWPAPRHCRRGRWSRPPRPTAAAAVTAGLLADVDRLVAEIDAARRIDRPNSASMRRSRTRNTDRPRPLPLRAERRRRQPDPTSHCTKCRRASSPGASSGRHRRASRRRAKRRHASRRRGTAAPKPARSWRGATPRAPGPPARRRPLWKSCCASYPPKTGPTETRPSQKARAASRETRGAHAETIATQFGRILVERRRRGGDAQVLCRRTRISSETMNTHSIFFCLLGLRSRKIDHVRPLCLAAAAPHKWRKNAVPPPHSRCYAPAAPRKKLITPEKSSPPWPAATNRA